MDNLAAHKRGEVSIAIDAAGAWLLYLPPYSPDLNPIEMASAKLSRPSKGGRQINRGFGQRYRRRLGRLHWPTVPELLRRSRL
jgi:transposase